MQLAGGKERQFWFYIHELPHALMCMDGAETYDIPNICMHIMHSRDATIGVASK